MEYLLYVHLQPALAFRCLSHGLNRSRQYGTLEGTDVVPGADLGLSLTISVLENVLKHLKGTGQLMLPKWSILEKYNSIRNEEGPVAREL